MGWNDSSMAIIRAAIKAKQAQDDAPAPITPIAAAQTDQIKQMEADIAKIVENDLKSANTEQKA